MRKEKNPLIKAIKSDFNPAQSIRYFYKCLTLIAAYLFYICASMMKTTSAILFILIYTIFCCCAMTSSTAAEEDCITCNTGVYYYEAAPGSDNECDDTYSCEHFSFIYLHHKQANKSAGYKWIQKYKSSTDSFFSGKPVFAADRQSSYVTHITGNPRFIRYCKLLI